MQAANCPALFISAPGSHHGKTSVTAALARFHARAGRKVRVFKTGADYLDPMLHEHASGQPVYQLDLWMGGEAHCRRLLFEAARDADLILIEGVMGLYDGQPSSADLAQLLGVPVLAVIDASGVAQTCGAIALGLAQYRPELPFAGVLANLVAGARHSEMIEQGLPAGMHYFGALQRDPKMALPERHLGLVQADEVSDLDARLECAADAVAATAAASLPQPQAFSAQGEPAPARLLKGVRIAVARDAAFSFLYRANLDLLQELGAELVFFSPLADSSLPQADSVYLPGGYPELHLQRLQDNRAMTQALRAHFDGGRPIYAECGGMLYLLDSLTDKQGASASMAGLLPGKGVMQARLHGLGYQIAPMPGGDLRCHTFHHSSMEIRLEPIAHGQRVHNTSPGEAIYRSRRLTASYLHAYFPSNPAAAAELFLP